MANNLEDYECEAISLLQASNPKAFKVMIEYFQKMFTYEAVKCVDDSMDMVAIRRGRARAFRDAMKIHDDAIKRLNEQ
jgi:hypothetical protein